MRMLDIVQLPVVLRFVELLPRLNCSRDSIEMMTLLFQPFTWGKQDFFANGLCPARRSVVAPVDSFSWPGLGTMVPSRTLNFHSLARGIALDL